MKSSLQPKLGFNINEILLMESSFSRPYKLPAEGSHTANVDIDVAVSRAEKIIGVRMTIIFTQHCNSVEQVRFKVEMFGKFECFEAAILENYERFGKTEGAEIIYPYIREHIANITSKSYERAIVLPPLIFRVAERNEQSANALDASEASSEISEIDKKSAESK